MARAVMWASSGPTAALVRQPRLRSPPGRVGPAVRLSPDAWFCASVNPVRTSWPFRPPLVNAALTNKPDMLISGHPPTPRPWLGVPLLVLRRHRPRTQGVKVGLGATPLNQLVTLRSPSVPWLAIVASHHFDQRGWSEPAARCSGYGQVDRAGQRRVMWGRPKGTVLVIAFKNGVSTSDQRTKASSTPSRSTRTSNCCRPESAGRKTPAKATTIVNGTLSEHPDLVGIFATNHDVASGAATAIRQVNKQGQIKIVGVCDAGPCR